MGAVMMLFLMLWLGSGYAGIRLLSSIVVRTELEPAIPPARLANPSAVEYAYQQTTDLASRSTRKIGRGLVIALGVFLLAWPFAVVIWFFATGPHLGIGSL
jgi:hypothetical protein